MPTPERVKEFWNERAALGPLAGTNDFQLTEIEQAFILKWVPKYSRVLDIGCGNGSTLIKLAQQSYCIGVGIDYADMMLEQARSAIEAGQLHNIISIHNHKIPPVPTDYGKFDIAISNRCIINLSTMWEQKQAVQSVEQVLTPGGQFLMIECSQDGSDRTNKLRDKFGLYPINPPWHNLFMKEADVESWQTPTFRIEKLIHISSTYHFLSRVVYAALADKAGEELKYDSDINNLAVELPQEIGDFGPVKCWLWRKSYG